MSFWDNIIKPKPVLQARVGEGMTPEQTATAKTVIAKKDVEPIKSNVGNFWDQFVGVTKGIPQATVDVGKKFVAGGVPAMYKPETPATYKEALQTRIKETPSRLKSLVPSYEDTINAVSAENPEVRKLAQEKINNFGLTLSVGNLEKTASAKIAENISILKDILSNHPGTRLKKYVSRSTGLLPEVTGKTKIKSPTGSGKNIKTSRFGREGDSISQEILDQYRPGMTAQEAIDEVDNIRNKIKELESQLHLKFDSTGKPLAYTAREQAIVDKQKIPFIPEKKVLPSQPKVSQLDTTTGEGRSLERLALQETKGPVVKNDSSLIDIIKKEPTPVKQKVNIIDYIRTPDRVLEKIGLKKEVDTLRTQHDLYLKELPKNIEKITAWSKRASSTGNRDIFRWLDGQPIELKPEDKVVAMEIKQWLKQWADRLGLKSEERLTHYITHIFDQELLAKEFPEELAKMIQNKIPGEVYNPFMQERLGALGYKEDTWAALDAYVKRATRKVYMDPALEMVKEASNKLDISAFNYVKNYTNSINMRPSNLDTLIDNGIKSVIGYRLGQRPLLSVTKFLRQMTYRAMLGLNPASALKNISQGINTYAKLGEKYTTIGYINLLKKGAKEELLRENVLSGGFIEDRALSATKKAIEKFDKTLFIFFETAEHINRGAAYFGAKAQALAKGMGEKEAIEYAKKIVRDTQFVFGKIDTPLALSSDLGKTIGQFQSFTLKQGEFLAEMMKKAVKGDQKAKNFIGLIRYAMAGTVFVYTIGKAFNMKINDLIPGVRFGTPPSLKVPVEIGKAVLDAPDKYGKKRDLKQKVKDIGNTLWGIVPAGIQAKKSIQGYEAIKEGANIDSAGRTMFDVGGTPLKNAQALVFGKYASSEAKDYYENDMTYAEATLKNIKKLPPEEAKAKLLGIVKDNPALFRSIVQVVKKQARGITDEDQKLLNLGVANKARAKEVAKQFNKLKTKEEKAAFLRDYVNKKILTNEVLKQLPEFIEK